MSHAEDQADSAGGSPPLASLTVRSQRHAFLLTLAPAIVILAAGLAAYANSFQGVFLFDDFGSVHQNVTIRRLWPIWLPLSTPRDAKAVQNRPIVNLSLAVNYALGGLDPWGYHAGNLAIHLAAALLLFGIVRRTLRLPKMPAYLRAASTSLALAVALIWTVHPLQTEAVTYITQRNESLAGMFYLLTLYCVLRGAEAGGGRWWYPAAIAACAFGMGSKETMITAPLMVLLYDRVFLCESFREIARRRWDVYAVFAGVVLAFFWMLMGAGGERLAASFELEKISWWAYPQTQFGVVAHYLRLCFWPAPLVIDYGTPLATHAAEIVPYALLILVLWGATAVALRYRPWLGFLGAWVFVVLLPSSSIVPLVGQTAAEKRMYLPLAGVVTAVVMCGYFVGRYVLQRFVAERPRQIIGRLLAFAGCGCVVLLLGILTFSRNQDYHSLLSIWDDACRKHPDNLRALMNRGNAYGDSGDLDLAIRDFDLVLARDPKRALAYFNRALAYQQLGQPDRAISDFTEAITLEPSMSPAYNARGLLLLQKGAVDAASHDFDEAIQWDPGFVHAYVNRGQIYGAKGNFAAAREDFEIAARLNPQEPSLPGVLDTFAAACAEAGRFAEAVEAAEKAAQLAADAGNQQLAHDIRGRLQSYRAKTPLRPQIGP